MVVTGAARGWCTVSDATDMRWLTAVRLAMLTTLSDHTYRNTYSSLLSLHGRNGLGRVLVHRNFALEKLVESDAAKSFYRTDALSDATVLMVP